MPHWGPALGTGSLQQAEMGAQRRRTSTVKVFRLKVKSKWDHVNYVWTHLCL